MNTGMERVGPLARAWVDAALTEATANADREHSTTWSWRCTATTIELRGDLPPVPDPHYRELMLTGGALLLNLRVLIRGLGVHVAVQIMPDRTQRDLIAIVLPEGPRTITDEDQELVDAVLLSGPGDRRSSRELVTKSLIIRLRRAAKVEQTWLAQLPGGYRRPSADSIRSREGTGADAGSESAIVVIGTVLDGAVTQLQAGQAMQRVLHTAVSGGVSARTMPTAFRDVVHRKAVRDLIGGGLWPQAMLLLGDTPPPRVVAAQMMRTVVASGGRGVRP